MITSHKKKKDVIIKFQISFRCPTTCKFPSRVRANETLFLSRTLHKECWLHYECRSCVDVERVSDTLTPSAS